MDQKNIFQRKPYIILFALIAMFAWGCAYPFIKLGMRERNIAISMTGFILYNQLICWNPISEIAIFNALIPVFGTLMSCLMLGETFGLQNLIGLACTCLGIFILHYRPEEAAI